MKYFILLALCYPLNAFINHKDFKRITRIFMVKVKVCPTIKRIERQKYKIHDKLDEICYILENQTNNTKLNTNQVYKKTIDNASSDIADELAKDLDDTVSSIFEINKDYILLITLIINELIKFNLREIVSTKRSDKGQITRLFVKNIIVPYIIHYVVIHIIVFFKHIHF